MPSRFILKRTESAVVFPHGSVFTSCTRKKLKLQIQTHKSCQLCKPLLRIGPTQVFLRKNAHDFLEMIRSQRITSAAVTLQRMVRGFVYRRVFYATRNALLLIQRMSRGMIVSALFRLFFRLFFVCVGGECSGFGEPRPFCLQEPIRATQIDCIVPFILHRCLNTAPALRVLQDRTGLVLHVQPKFTRDRFSIWPLLLSLPQAIVNIHMRTAVRSSHPKVSNFLIKTSRSPIPIHFFCFSGPAEGGAHAADAGGVAHPDGFPAAHGS